METKGSVPASVYKHFKNVSLISFLLFLLFSFTALAKHEEFRKQLIGNQIAALKPLDVYDNKFSPPIAPDWEAGFHIRSQKVTNQLALKIDAAGTTYIAQSYTCSVKLEVKYKNAKDQLFTIYPVLFVEYTNGMNATETDQNVYQFFGGHEVNVNILEVNTNYPSGTPGNLILENLISIERFYEFNPFEVRKPLTITSMDADNELEIRWQSTEGAEEYQLEWLFVNNYDGETTNGERGSLSIGYDFNNNASRISVPGTINSYRIARVFEKGYVMFRYRAVGRTASDNKTPVYGNWNNPTKGTLGDYSIKEYYKIINAHEKDNKNWFYSASYAEEGKKKETVSYMDGTSRDRQMVSRLNTENQTIAGETIYDHEGRPAVNILPVPTGSTSIGYYPMFNLNDQVPKKPFSSLDFEKSTPANSCGLEVSKLNNTSGAARYYSPLNPAQSGHQAFLPNAAGYPFTQVEYTPDNTGRINRQGGLGADFQLGSNHESIYYYGKPLQEQLDKMFGSEVGNYSHYKKNMMRDPNGQLSVSYLDQQGRIIATALAGNAPQSLDPVVTPTISTTVNILDNQDIAKGDRALRSQFVYLANTAGTHEFSYQVTPASLDGRCEKPFCLDCMYDLEISIKDECGKELVKNGVEVSGEGVPVKQAIGNYDDVVCNSIGDAVVPTFTVFIPKSGTYYINKTLTVNEKSINSYKQTYLADKNSCVKSLKDFVDEQFSKTDLSCDPLGDCLTSCDRSVNRSDFATDKEYNRALETCRLECKSPPACPGLYEELLADMSPGGQYAEYGTEHGTGRYYPLNRSSIYHPDNLFNGEGNIPVDLGVFEFKDENGNIDAVTLPNGDKGTPAQLFDASLTDFIKQWKPSWATAVVGLHPEYAYYDFCNKYKEIEDYEMLMLNTGTYEEALRLGLLNPLGMGTGDVNIPIPTVDNSDPLPIRNMHQPNSNIDPLFQNNPGAFGMMTYFLSDAINTDGGLILGLWKTSAAAVICPDNNPACAEIVSNFKFYPLNQTDPCVIDKVWKIFRAKYLTERRKYINAFRESHLAGERHKLLGVAGTPFEFKIRRFSDLSADLKDQLNDKYDIISGTSNNESDTFENKDSANAAINRNCNEQCEGYADQWMIMLSGCDPTGENWKNKTAIYYELRGKLIEVCRKGCDMDHSEGASTINPANPGVPSGRPGVADYTSFADVIKGILNKDVLSCNANLITMPPPYDHASSSLKEEGNIDSCVCNKVLFINQLYNNLSAAHTLPAGATKTSLFEKYYNVKFDELNSRVCLCNTAFSEGGSGSWSVGAPWSQASVNKLKASKEVVPDELTCAKCFSCDFVKTKVNEFKAITEAKEGGSIPAEKKNLYERSLVTYLNNKLNIDLTLNDYEDFLLNCENVQSGGLTCKTTPAARDLNVLLDFLVQRNELLGHARLCNSPYTPASPAEKAKRNFSYTDLLVKYADPAFIPGVTACDYLYCLDHVNGNTLFGKISSNGLDKCALELTFLKTGFDFSNIVYFNNLRVDPLTPGNNYNFLVEATVLVDGEVVETTMKGKTTCIPVAECSNDINKLTLCSNIKTPPADDCVHLLVQQLLMNSKTLYQNYINKVSDEFEASYLARCLGAANSEKFTMKYNDGEYHYTLYYYDQAGNLVRTIPPDGVELLSDADVKKVAIDRKNGTRTVFTKHRLATTYRYNSLNQLVSQSMPDHDNMNEWKLTSLGSSLPAGTEITDAGVNPSFTYMFTADTDPLKSRIYYRSTGNANWEELKSIVLSGLKDVSFLPGSPVYAVGDKGTLLKSTNGTTWTIKATPISEDIIGVNFISSTDGFIFTKSGKVYKTTDGADSWTLLSSSGLDLEEINEVSFINQLTGVAVGIKESNGAIFRTSDGGATWTANQAIASRDLKSIQFIGTGGVAFAAGIDGVLLKSTDGGNTWITISTGLTVTFKEIHFKDRLNGCAIADGKLWYTESGGYSWTQPLQTVMGDEYVDLCFVNDNTGYALSKKGYVQATYNSGKSWTEKYKHNILQDLTTISIESNRAGYVAGNNGTVINTSDINEVSNWITRATNLGTKAAKELHAKGGEVCALLNDGNIWYSATYGISWSKITSSGNYVSVSFTSGDVGYALTSDGTVVYTATAGANWMSWSSSSGGNAIGLAASNAAPNWSPTATDVVVVGNGGKISKLVNGSSSWSDITYAVKSPLLNGVNVVNSSTAYATGKGGILLRTLDGGITWNTIASGTKNDLNDVGVTGNNAILVGDNGLILYSSTINLAVPTWTVTPAAGALGNHQRVLFYGTSGYITSSDGKILKSSNNGAIWASYYNGTNPLFGICLATSSNGFFVGNDGTIIKMTSGTPELLGTVVRPSRILDSHQVGNIAYAVGIDRTVLRSDNGGRSWTQIYIPMPPYIPLTTDFRGVMFTETSAVIIVGDGVICSKKESESTWTTFVFSGNMEDVYVIDDNNMYAVGDGDAVYRSTSGGKFWNQVIIDPYMPSVNLKSVHIVSPVGYIVGTNGTILKSDDVMAAAPGWKQLKAANGDDWTKYTRPDHTTVALNDVYFTDLTTGYAAGNSGTLLKTINGGKSWELKQSNSASDLLGIVSAGDNHIMILGKGSVFNDIYDNSDNLSTRFYYDRLGRLVASQNSKQFSMAVPRFSYIRYDAQNRILETGEFAKDVSTLTAEMINNPTFPDNLNFVRYNMVTTKYDEAYSKSVSGYFGTAGQQNLRNRVSTVAIFEERGADRDYFDHATHYSYDVHGNVKSVIQDTPSLEDK